MTKTNKTRQNGEKTAISLTGRQIKALPFIVASSTYTAGCKKAKVDRTSFYRWLDEPAFKQELERQQKAVSDQALGMMAQNVTAAVERLARLINDSDKRLARLACKDMLELRLKYVELNDLEERFAAVEEKLKQR
ncbi:MAG: hypothetical protein HQ515_07675 [Phycisphaeraceae bacterium]|nr:hypothetical protein [Phycisphaeraceae bacterium]